MGNFFIAGWDSDLIAVVKAVDYSDYFILTGAAPNDINQPLSVKFEIIEVIKGQENNKYIKVFGDIGNLCRPYIHTFELDQYYIVAITRIKEDIIHEQHNITEQKDDYFIWICGEYWVRYSPETKKAKGHFVKKKWRRKYKEYDIEAIRNHFT